MWFGKKNQNIEMTLPSSPKSQLSDEIELIPEELPSMPGKPEIPDEIPELEIKSRIAPQQNVKSNVIVPEKEDSEINLMASEEQVEQKPQQIQFAKKEPTIQKQDKFISTETHNAVLASINSIGSAFGNMDDEIGQTMTLQRTRNERIDNLQSTLEDASKKLMIIDQTLFGG